MGETRKTKQVAPDGKRKNEATVPQTEKSEIQNRLKSEDMQEVWEGVSRKGKL